MPWVSDWNALHYQGEPPDLSVQQWMQCSQSLTDRAKTLFQDVEIRLLNETWFSKDQFIREIHMLCDDFVGWYARTTIPLATYENRKEQWQALKNKPLGSILFHDPAITRGLFEYVCLLPDMPEYQWAMAARKYANPPLFLWARRSTFFIHDQAILYPLYLLEVFFSEIFFFG